MARFKPAGSRKTKPAESKRGLLPCLFLLLMGVAFLTWLFYAFVKSGP
jgi:hypothetical protein